VASSATPGPPAKKRSVDPDANFQMIWEVDPKRPPAERYRQGTEKAPKLILATDLIAEGEAISLARPGGVRKKTRAERTMRSSGVVFNAITKQAITDAMKNPRQIDGRGWSMSYMARRALDYLVGFFHSPFPLLWRKLPGARSAGRVQSVALRTRLRIASSRSRNSSPRILVAGPQRSRPARRLL